MAFQDDEIGAATSQPIETYSFLGTYNNYYLTSYAEDVTSGGQLYSRVPMKRNRLKVGTQAEKEISLEIQMPYDHPLMNEYAYQTSPPSLIMELRRLHVTDLNDSILMWKGRVTAFAIEGVFGKLRVPSIFSYILQGNTPTPRFQAPCNHVLYDSSCGVDPSLNQGISTISSISSNVIAVASSPFLTNEAVGGPMILPSGEQRMIVGNVGTSFTLSYPFSGANLGDSVIIRKGCNHSMSECDLKFGNKDRFGGFPAVPDVNPFTSNIG